jgi:hypothetical protein
MEERRKVPRERIFSMVAPRSTKREDRSRENFAASSQIFSDPQEARKSTCAARLEPRTQAGLTFVGKLESFHIFDELPTFVVGEVRAEVVTVMSAVSVAGRGIGCERNGSR